MEAEIIKHYGLLGLILYFSFKEMWIFYKKKMGKFVSFDEITSRITNLNSTMEKHIQTDLDKFSILDIAHARQEEKNIAAEHTADYLRSEIGGIRRDISEIRTILMTHK